MIALRLRRLKLTPLFAFYFGLLPLLFAQAQATEKRAEPESQGDRLSHPYRGDRGRRMAEFGGQGPRRLLRALRSQKLQKELSLTEEQRTKLEDFGFNAAKTMIEQRAAIQVQRLKLHRLMASENPDRGAIDQTLNKIAETRGSLSRSLVNFFLDARNVLTEEQRDKLRQLMRKKVRQRFHQRERRKHFRGRYPTPPPEPPGQ